MLATAALLEWLDGEIADERRRLARLEALRAEVAANLSCHTTKPIDEFSSTEVPDDLAEANLLDTTAASARFGFPRCTVTRWCREGDGVKRGGRWLASVPRLQRRLNGA